jgi:hypothetical protein
MFAGRLVTLADGGNLWHPSPSQNGHSREFLTRFANSGGERYSVTFGDDETSTNFFYDGWIYLTGSSSQIANLEFDMNQIMSNGQTATYGVQCDGYSNTVGLHKECRKSCETFRPVGALDRVLQPACLGNEYVASCAALLFPR